MDSDKTVGRTNVNVAASPSRGAPSRVAAPSSSDAAAPLPPPAASAISPGGGSIQWPTSAGHYELSERIGQGAFASVWRARVKGSGARKRQQGDEEGADDQCAIKIMDLEHVNINISDIRLEVQTMRLSSHPNILVCHTSFVRDTDLWLVTQLMSKGSSLHCLQSARTKLLTDAAMAAKAAGLNSTYDPAMHASDDSVLEGGLTAHSSIIAPESLLFEAQITYALYETLLGLKYIHDNGQIHRDIKAGNLLLDGGANVRIADFGVSSWLIDGGSRREHTTTFVGTPCWMAPEVMEQVDGYDYKADIWSLGITALELCKGYAPYAKFAPMKVLLLTIQEDPPNFETYNDGDDVNMWSKSFRSMIKLCLQKDPARRPTCQDLLAHRHFKPLASADGRAQWRERTRTELCDAVDDVGTAGSGGGGTAAGERCLPGTAPIQVVSHQKKDRPAGTSWILPGGSQVSTSSLQTKSSAADDFYSQFEQQTGGENFNRESVLLDEANKAQMKEKEEEDDINDFFDEFEKATGGENFRRTS